MAHTGPSSGPVSRPSHRARDAPRPLRQPPPTLKLLGAGLCALLPLLLGAATPQEPAEAESRPESRVTLPTRTIRVPGVTASLQDLLECAECRIPHKERGISHDRQPPPRLIPGLEAEAPGREKAEALLRAGPEFDLSGVLESSGATPPLLQSFIGIGWNLTLEPPDTQGAVGIDHLVSILNVGFAIFDKATGAYLFGPITHQEFWSPLGTMRTQPASRPFDPKVIFDPYSERFVVVALGGGGDRSSWVMVAISNDTDPMLGFTLFAMQFDLPEEDEHVDFPDLGVDPEHVYITANVLWNPPLNGYTRSVLYVLDKASLLAGSLVASEFEESTGGYASRATRAAGPTPVNYILSEGWTAGGATQLLRVKEISFPEGEPILTDLGFIQVAPYGFDYFYEVPQPDNIWKAGANDTRLLDAVLRDGRIWATHHVDDPIADGVGKTEIAWYEIDPGDARPSPPFAGPVQWGRVSHPERWYYFPSIAVNAHGSVALGFSGSSPTEYIGGYYTMRERSDPPGTMRPVALLKEGERTYEYWRWGDYSQTVVDPVDGLTFWTIQEYAAIDGPPHDPNHW